MPHRSRGFSGVPLLGLLLGVAIILILMSGNFGGSKSVVQQAAQAKKEGNTLSLGIQGEQLAILFSDDRMGHDGKAPASYDDLGVPPSSFIDSWGRPPRFSFGTPARDADHFMLTSDGPVGAPGIPGDVSVRVPLRF